MIGLKVFGVQGFWGFRVLGVEGFRSFVGFKGFGLLGFLAAAKSIADVTSDDDHDVQEEVRVCSVRNYTLTLNTK